MSICEDRITEDSTEFEKEFLKIYDGNLWAALDKMKDWQPPKKLVVVPQLVADYIETQKGNDFDRVGTLVYGHFGTLVYGRYAADDRSEKHSELHKWITDNFDAFLEAIVNGYTVEKPKEKLYFVKLPGTPSLDSYMCKSCSPGEFGYHKEYSSKEPNKICFSNRYNEKYSGGWQRQFTKSEIKAIDERYWPFAVPVEEEQK